MWCGFSQQRDLSSSILRADPSWTCCCRALLCGPLGRRAALGTRRKSPCTRFRLARAGGRFRGGEIAPGRTCAAWAKVDAPELSSGPICEIQEVSRVGAQGVTSKSKLLAREMPRVCSRGVEACRRRNCSRSRLRRMAPCRCCRPFMCVGGRSAGCTLGVGTRLLHFHLLVLRDVLPKAAQQLHGI